MPKRFVYPVLIWGGKKQCLLIQRETEDGQNWFGIEEAIEHYCEDMSLEVQNIEWLVWSEPINDYVSIKAKNLNDWVKQFNSIKVTWKNVG